LIQDRKCEILHYAAFFKRHILKTFPKKGKIFPKKGKIFPKNDFPKKGKIFPKQGKIFPKK
jgi:hypothetical protein